jgi:myo-inositol-1(or 4)-monophosphatase
MSNFEDLLPIASEAVDVGRRMFLRDAPGLITAKGDRDMASEVDYAIERAIDSFLRERTPGVGFLGEECSDRAGSQELTWTLDPVDGTANFIHGSPLCAISLALIHDGRPVLGVVDLPFLGMRYTAVEGHGTHRDGRRLSVSARTAPRSAVVAIGDYAVGAGAEVKNATRLGVTERLASTVERIRMHGSAALDLAWLAEGRIDGVVILSNKPWDTAAGVIIAREAGAHVVDLYGRPHTVESDATIGSNPELLPHLLKLVALAPGPTPRQD